GMRRLAPAAPAGSWQARLRAAALVSPCALVGTAPLTAFHFHQVSLVGLVANPLAIPIFGSAVVVLGLVGAVVEPVAPGAAAALFRTAGLVLWPGIALVRTLAKPAWAAVDVPIPSVLELALVYGLLAALLWLQRRGARALALVALAGPPGAVPDLLPHVRPRESWSTVVPGDGVQWERLEAALAASGTRVRLLAAGASLPALAGATEVLHPPADGGYASLNDSSLT